MLKSLFLILLLRIAGAGAQEVVVVYASSGLGPLNPFIQGFLHGKDEQGNLDPSAVETLSPGSWRLYKSATYNIAESFPVRITYTLSDHYAWSQGGYPSAKPWLDWKGYEDYIRAEVEYIYACYPDNPPEFFDIWNEPDHPYFWTGTYQQLLELYSRCAEVVWSVNADAKLVGPSISRYIEGSTGVAGVIPFLSDLDTEYGLRLDAVSWHENESGILGSDRPEHILDHAASIRSGLEETFGSGYSPELHVNEYSGRYVHLSPGYNAGYLHYLLEAEIDMASRSAWTVYSPYDPPYGYWSDCWSGLDGMFNWDGYTPQVIYWVYEFFGRMLEKERLQTWLPFSGTVAEAVRDDIEEMAMIMIGRYNHDDEPTDLAVYVQDWPYYHDSVHVVCRRIPHDPGFFNPVCPITVAMPEGPSDSLIMDLAVTGGDIQFQLEGFLDNDVWLCTISEAGSTSIGQMQDPVPGFSVLPSPFSTYTTVRFYKDSAGHVSLSIFDICGRLVDSIDYGYWNPGHHQLTWDGRDTSGQLLPAGVYRVVLETGQGSACQSLVILR